MIITQEKSKTNFNLKSETFKINFSPVAFDILSSRLYKDSLYAMIRELLCNAYDSQVKAGTADKPISITLPNWKTGTNFIIRDYGTGISHEDIYDVYTCFFSSTKSNSNDYTGCFGLGSKTPFAFTDVFQVRSFQNGKVNTYLCTKANGIPSVTSLSLYEDTDEPNGFEVSVPFTNNSTDEEDIKKCIEKFLAFIPEIKTNVEGLRDFNSKKIEIIPNKLYQYTLDDLTYRYTSAEKRIFNVNFQGTFIKQGQNVYEVDLSKEVQNSYALIRHLNNTTYVYEVPIGTLQVTPSRDNFREDDVYTQVCVDFFTAIYNNIIKLCEIHNIEQLEKLKLINIYEEWFGRKYGKVDNHQHISLYYNNYPTPRFDLRLNNIIFKKTKENYDEHFKTDIIEGRFHAKQKVALIFLDNKHDKVPSRKLRMMAETLGYDCIGIIKSDDFEYYEKISKMLKTICDIKQLEFDVTCFTYDEFHTQIKNFKYVPNSPRYKRKIRVLSCTNNSYSYNAFDTFKNIEDFSLLFKPSDTLLVSNEEYNDLVEEILPYNTDFKEKTGYFFIKKTLDSIAKSQGINADTKIYFIIVDNEFTTGSSFKRFNMNAFTNALANIDFVVYCKSKNITDDANISLVSSNCIFDAEKCITRFAQRYKKLNTLSNFVTGKDYWCKMINLHNTLVKHYAGEYRFTWNDAHIHPFLLSISKYTDRDVVSEKIKVVPDLLFHTTRYLLRNMNKLRTILNQCVSFNKFYELSKFFRRKKHVLF